MAATNRFQAGTASAKRMQKLNYQLDIVIITHGSVLDTANISCDKYSMSDNVWLRHDISSVILGSFKHAINRIIICPINLFIKSFFARKLD